MDYKNEGTEYINWAHEYVIEVGINYDYDLVKHFINTLPLHTFLPL